MVKQLNSHGGYKCKECKWVMLGSEWMEREIRPNIFNPDYACPNCGKEVEIRSV